MSDQGSSRTPHPPGGGGRDTITAVPRTPGSVFLHWNLAGAGGADATRAAGPGGEWVLRVVDLSDGSSRTVPVTPERRRIYVDVAPGGVYGFELAVRGGGRWRTVCRTPRVEMPPAAPGSGRNVRSHPGPARGRAGIPGLDWQSTLPHLGSSLHGAPDKDRDRPRPPKPPRPEHGRPKKPSISRRLSEKQL